MEDVFAILAAQEDTGELPVERDSAVCCSRMGRAHVKIEPESPKSDAPQLPGELERVRALRVDAPISEPSRGDQRGGALGVGVLDVNEANASKCCYRI